MNQLITTIQTLQRVALLGTDRAGQQLPVQPLPTATDAARQPLPVSMSVPASALALQWLAQTDVIYRAAGGHVRITEQAITQAPDLAVTDGDASGSPTQQPRRILPPAAHDALTQCLAMGESGSALVIHLLESADASGTYLPHAALPDVLPFLFAHREACLNPFQWQNLLGARGQWLAQQNPAWSGINAYAADRSAQDMTLDDWALASTQQRLLGLKLMREKDAAQARAWIESTRTSDPPAEVASYVAACQTGLSMDDHDWLEGLLDAKHKPVRTAAAACLARLPSSALCLRALDYLTLLGGAVNASSTAPAVLGITSKRSLFGLIKEAPLLHITLPPTETFDKAMDKQMARDGYDIKAKSSSTTDAALGPKLSLVLQWLSVAPLDKLLLRLNVSYADFFAIAASHESKEDLIEALAKSLLAQTESRSPEHVIEALLATECVPSELALTLIQRLPAAQKEVQLLKPHISCGVHDLCQVFSATEGMGAGLSQWILDFLRSHKHAEYNRAWNSSDTVALALRLDTDLAESFWAEARDEQARNTADTPTDKACYAAKFWQPLFQAIELCTQYRRVLKPR